MLPPPFTLTDITDILRTGDRRIIFWRGEQVCPQQVNMGLPHPPSRQTRMPLFDTLLLIALWHAGRIKGGIFHMQL